MVEVKKNAKNLFQHKTDWFELVFLGFLSTGLLIYDARTDSSNHFIKQTTVTIAGPIQYLIDIPATLIHRFSYAIQTHDALLAENHDLKKALLEARLKLQSQIQTERKNRVLEALFQAKKTYNYNATIARVLAIDLAPYRQSIVINKGTQENSHVGQTVIDAYGMVGKVVMTTPLTAEVLLISDSNFSIPVKVARSGVRAITYGTGAPNALEVKHVLGEVDIKIGDTLLTSGMGGQFPEGHPVAIVTRVAFSENTQAAQISARPIAALDRIEDVLLLHPMPSPETKSDTPTNVKDKPS